MSETNGKYAPLPGKIPGVAINLGGHDLVLAPLGLGLMRHFLDRGNQLVADGRVATSEENIDYKIDMILASLHRNYPEITREELVELLDNANLATASQLTLDQAGLKQVKPGEIQPVK